MPLPAPGAPAPAQPRGRHRAPGPARRRHAATATSPRTTLGVVAAGLVAAVVLGSAGWSASATAVAQAEALGRTLTGSDAVVAGPDGSHALQVADVDLPAGTRSSDDLPDKSLLAAARVAATTARGAVVVGRASLRTAAATAPRRKPLPGWELGQTPPREVVRANVSVLAVVRRYFPASQVGNAMAVVDCESSQQWWQRGPVNRNGTRDWGLFQFNDGGTLQGTLTAIGVRYTSLRQAQALALNPDINARMAIHLYRDRGWSPWVCAYTQGIVAALWSNEPGPMAGRYDVGGDPLPLTPPSATPAPTPTTSRRPAPRPTPSPTVPRRPSPAPTTPSPTPAPSSPLPEPGPSTPSPDTTAASTTPGAQGSVVSAAPPGS